MDQEDQDKTEKSEKRIFKKKSTFSPGSTETNPAIIQNGSKYKVIVAQSWDDSN